MLRAFTTRPMIVNHSNYAYIVILLTIVEIRKDLCVSYNDAMVEPCPSLELVSHSKPRGPLVSFLLLPATS